MKNQSLRFALVAICFSLLALPFITAYGADGRLEGKVTDAKGAVVAGAKIVATTLKSGELYFTAPVEGQLLPYREPSSRPAEKGCSLCELCTSVVSGFWCNFTTETQRTTEIAQRKTLTQVSPRLFSAAC